MPTRGNAGHTQEVTNQPGIVLLQNPHSLHAVVADKRCVFAPRTPNDQPKSKYDQSIERDQAMF